MRALLVFAAVALADVLWTRWMLAASQGAAFHAACYSVGLILSGAYVTVAYISDRRYLLPAALGAFVGTYLSVAHG